MNLGDKTLRQRLQERVDRDGLHPEDRARLIAEIGTRTRAAGQERPAWRFMHRAVLPAAGRIAALMAGMLLAAVSGLLLLSTSALPPGPGATPTAVANDASPQTASEAPAPAETVPAAPAETPVLVGTPEPTIPPTVIGRSDAFWRAFSGGDFVNQYDSRAEVAEDADLVAIGRLTDLRFGDEVRSFGVIRATVLIEEVLKGEPQTERAGTITLQLPPVPRDRREWIRDAMPKHPHLLFLHYAPLELARDGQPTEIQQRERYDYVLLNGDQAVLRDIEGTTRPIDPTDLARFPARLNELPFSVIVDRVRELLSP